jgi:hypothetical protein
MSVPVSEIAILVTRNGMGYAEPALQQKLIGTYLKPLSENHIPPGPPSFYMEEVRLRVDGSPVLEQLQVFETQGVYPILYDACPNYFNLAKQVKVGIGGGMADILEARFKAGKAISL